MSQWVWVVTVGWIGIVLCGCGESYGPAPHSNPAGLQCTVLDFESSGSGDAIEHGRVLDRALADQGVRIDVWRASRCDDTCGSCEACTTTSCTIVEDGDHECRESCAACDACRYDDRGLSVAFDTDEARPGRPLDVPGRGNVLIAQKRFSSLERWIGRVWHPKVDHRGATFELSFRDTSCVGGLVLVGLDADARAPELRAYADDGRLLAAEQVEPTGDDQQQVAFGDAPVCGVARLQIQLYGRGAIDDVNVCRDLQQREAPVVARDHDPRPGVVEIELVADEALVDYGTGTPTRVWTYNGTIPGPTIEANVGDELIVHFHNRLPMPTTIHWHGVELPANMDGSNISQRSVPPGGYFRYRFRLLDASTFWYHPHIRSAKQVEKGLYGALVVRDPGEQCLGLPSAEHVLLLDDVLLDADGQLADRIPLDDPLENADRQLNGREGNVLLVNGRAQREIPVRVGQPQRLRLVSTANSRMMRVSLRGQRFWRIGGDGGLLPRPIPIEPIELVEIDGELVSDPDLSKGIILTPGERADVIFVPETDAEVTLEWHDYARGRAQTFYRPDGTIGIQGDPLDGRRPPVVMAMFDPQGDPGSVAYQPPPKLRDIAVVDASGADTIAVRFGHTLPDRDGNVTLAVQDDNGRPLPFDEITPADAPTVRVGDIRIWEVHNGTGGDHNFHTHGFFFQPLELVRSMNGQDVIVPFEQVENKDTILVPRGATLRAVARFDDTGREGTIEAFGKEPTRRRSGGWLFHCHILEHAERGMMSFLQVLDRDGDGDGDDEDCDDHHHADGDHEHDCPCD